MTQNINTKPALVRCLNGISCILINNKELLNACLSFRHKAKDMMSKIEDLNARQQQFKGVPIIPKAETGFMVGALKATYYIRRRMDNNLNKLPKEDYCMAVSGNFLVEPGSHRNQWLTAAPKFSPYDYKFITPTLDMKTRLGNFHNRYFKRSFQLDNSKINTIYGTRFTEFYDTYIKENEKDLSIPKKYQADLLIYNKVDNDGKIYRNPFCAAQQLTVYVGDRVADLKKTHQGEIVPLIEICEIWFPSTKGVLLDRTWPKYSASCPCDSCKIVLPYLITYKGGLGSQFKDLYRQMLGNLAKKRGWSNSDLVSVGLKS